MKIPFKWQQSFPEIYIKQITFKLEMYICTASCHLLGAIAQNFPDILTK